MTDLFRNWRFCVPDDEKRRVLYIEYSDAEHARQASEHFIKNKRPFVVYRFTPKRSIWIRLPTSDLDTFERIKECLEAGYRIEYHDYDKNKKDGRDPYATGS